MNNAVTLATIDSGIRTRFELLDKINKSIHELNEQFIANPSEINIITLRKLIRELVEINRFLEQQKIGLNNTWWTKHGNKVSPIFIGMLGIGSLMLIIINIFQYIPSAFDTTSPTQQPSTDGSSTCPPCQQGSSNPFDSRTLQAITAIFVIGVIFQVVGGVGSFFADRKDKKEQEIKDNLASLKPLGEEYLDKILEAMEIYKKKPNDQKDSADIQKCVKIIKKIPKDGGLARIEKKNLVPHMIEDLPPSHPLFTYYDDLKKTTLQDNDSDSAIADNGLNKEDSGSLTNDFEEVPIGENATSIMSLPTIGMLKRRGSMPIQRRRRHLFSQMEDALGFDLKAIRIGEKCLQHNGTITEAQPEPIPLLSDLESDSYAANIDKQFTDVIVEL